MKRTVPWSDDDGDSSSDESSDSQAEEKQPKPNTTTKPLSKASKVKAGTQNGGAVDFEALRRHGYKGGPSVLKVPVPKDDEKVDWSWSTGQNNREAKDSKESYEERQKTRAAIAEGEQLTRVQTRKEKSERSFSQKEKRKRELGQASRGKNYVEEEKRLLRDSGVYSGFDT